jgi:formamidopyrimidine-DNA glycosylase
MPELPEVETIKRVLEPQVKSLGILDITANRTDIICLTLIRNTRTQDF